MKYPPRSTSELALLTGYTDYFIKRSAEENGILLFRKP